MENSLGAEATIYRQQEGEQSRAHGPHEPVCISCLLGVILHIQKHR